MFRNHNIARLNRYRYEIAAATFLTVAAVALLAAAVLSSDSTKNIAGGAETQSPASSN